MANGDTQWQDSGAPAGFKDSAPPPGFDTGKKKDAQKPSLWDRTKNVLGLNEGFLFGGSGEAGGIAGSPRTVGEAATPLVLGAADVAAPAVGAAIAPVTRPIGRKLGSMMENIFPRTPEPAPVWRDATKLNEPFAGEEAVPPAPPEFTAAKDFPAQTKARLGAAAESNVGAGADERPFTPFKDFPLQTQMGMRQAARKAVTPPEAPPVRTSPFGEGATSSATATGGPVSAGAPASPFQGERVNIRGVTSPTPEEALGQALDELRTGPELPSRAADPSLVTGDTAQQTLNRTSRAQAESMVPKAPRLGTTTSTAPGAPEIAHLRTGLREGSAGDLATWKEDDLWAGFMKNRGTPFGNNLAAEIQRRGLATTPANAVRPSGGFFGSSKPPTPTPAPSSSPSPTSSSGIANPQGGPTPFQPFGTALRPEVQQMATPSGAAKVPDWVAGQRDFEIQRLKEVLRNPSATAEERQIAQQQLDFHLGSTQ